MRDTSRPNVGGFFVAIYYAGMPAKVFNILVENSVEKADRIVVTDSSRDASTLCTGASAGTFVVVLPVRHDLHSKKTD
jgi:nitrogen regulatory protein PII-like uncharacterized protein